MAALRLTTRKVEMAEIPAGIDLRSRGYVGFTVEDNGEGMRPEVAARAVEPFYTTKEPDENGHGGTGLGLSVCRQIIEQHHGRIRVESVVGKGSTFTVKLPIRSDEGRD